MAQAEAVADELLTPLEVAWRLKCSTSWVYRQVRTGAWASIETPLGMRIPAEALDEYEAEKANRPSRDEATKVAARRLIELGQQEGVLPEKLAPAALARIARAIRTVELH